LRQDRRSPRRRLAVREERGGVLFLNPGSAGPRRFRLPIAVARLRVAGDRLAAEILPLDV
jgi:hypothetical protein